MLCSQISSDVNKATTPKAAYLKAKNTTTFPRHLYRTIDVGYSEVIFSFRSSLEISQYSISIVIRLNQITS